MCACSVIEKEMTSHSSFLAGKSHRLREEPGGLQSMGSQRDGHDWATSLHLLSHVYFHLVGYRLFCPWDSPGKHTRVGSLSLLQEIIPTQGLNTGLPHCWWILYQLSHKGSPRTLEWVAYPFSRVSFQPKNTGVDLHGIFPTQESKRGLLHCRQILYQLSYKGSLHIC